MKTLKEVYGYSKTKKLNKNQLRNLIEEIFSIDEKADPSKVDDERFPLKLSDVDQEFAQKAVNSDPSKEDTIAVTGASKPVQKLKPSQSSMNIDKAMAQAIAMIQGDMDLGGNINAFISNDDHIMDGHHRWVATAMVDPSQPVGGYQVDFPAKKLIAVLNAITVGKYGETTGKPATGGFDQFKEGPVRATLKKFAKDGIKGNHPRSTENIQRAIEKFVSDNGGEEKGDAAIDKAADIMVGNLSSIKFETPPGAPSRENMPVIDNPSPAITALTTGQVDVNPPYQTETEEDSKKQEEGTWHKGNVIVERWNKLAGLLNE